MKAAPQNDIGTAFVTLRPALYNYLRRQVNDPVIVDDVIQEVFLKAIYAVESNRRVTNWSGWLYAAARTTVADHYRSRLPTTTLDDNSQYVQQIDDDLLQQELAACLLPLVQELAPKYRDALLATDFGGQTMQSVASELGLSVSAIKSRVGRARMKLKEKLQRCCEITLLDGRVTEYRRRSSASCVGNCT